MRLVLKPRNRIFVSHLLFADDILLFGEVNNRTADAMLRTLQSFHE